MTHAEYMRRWREKHPENKEYQRQYHKKYYSGKNAEKAKRRSRKYYQDNTKYVKKYSLEYYRKHRVLKGRATGERNGFWKGDNVGYHGLHKWVKKWKQRPDSCELCGIRNKKFQWASKSREYKRDLNDWINLCCKCHYHYDKQHERKRDWHGRHIKI